jgi:hypothetical protein
MPKEHITFSTNRVEFGLAFLKAIENQSVNQGFFIFNVWFAFSGFEDLL